MGKKGLGKTWRRDQEPGNYPGLLRDLRRVEKELTLTHVAAHVGTQGNEIADRMAMLAVQRKEKKLRPYQETIDIPALLKMRTG